MNNTAEQSNSSNQLNIMIMDIGDEHNKSYDKIINNLESLHQDIAEIKKMTEGIKEMTKEMNKMSNSVKEITEEIKDIKK